MRLFGGLTLAVTALSAAAACAAGATDGPADGVPPAGSDAAAPGTDGGPPPATSPDADAPTDAGAPPPPADAGLPPPQHDSGPVATPDSGGTCALPAAAKTGVAACDQCQQTSCCALIAACLDNNAPCAAIYGCTQSCDNGTSPDGGTFDSTDAGAVDQCWTVCEQGQGQASTFDNQDTCVSSSCKTPCGL